MQFKLTKKEKSWIFYDVGNSAFVLMVSTILPVYFNYLAQNAGVSDVDYLAFWGYAASISTLIVAVLGPVMGTLADTRGFKKPLFLSCILVGCAGCLLTGLTTWWISFLVIFIIFIALHFFGDTYCFINLVTAGGIAVAYLKCFTHCSLA